MQHEAAYESELMFHFVPDPKLEKKSPLGSGLKGFKSGEI